MGVAVVLCMKVMDLVDLSPGKHTFSYLIYLHYQHVLPYVTEIDGRFTCDVKNLKVIVLGRLISDRRCEASSALFLSDM